MIFNIQNITFTGTTKSIKNHYVASREGIYEINSTKNTEFASCVLGSIPSQWITNIKPENRKNFIYNIYHILAKYANHARAASSYSLNIDTQKLQQELNNIGLCVNKIDPTINQGSYGGVLCLDVGKAPNNKKYALKIFVEDYENNIHGNISEQKIALLLNHRTQGKRGIAKFHFGDIDAGYMVCDYIDKISKPKKHFYPQTQGFIFIDAHNDNIINTYIIDYGGFRAANNLVSNQEARKKVHIIENMPEGKRFDFWQKVFNTTAEQLKTINSTTDTKPIADNYLTLAISILFLDSLAQNIAIVKLLQKLEELPAPIKIITARGLSSIIADIENMHPQNSPTLTNCCEKLLALNDKMIEKNIIKSKIAEKIIKQKTYF